MVCARGGNRRTIYHKCIFCGKKKMYLGANILKGYGLYAKCQHCQGASFKQSTVDKLLEEELLMEE